MVKAQIIFSALVIGLFLFPSIFLVRADEVCPKGYENLCRIDIATNPNIFGNVVQILIVTAVILSVIYLVWGGIIWIRSGGDKGKIEQAKAAITGAIIGLVITFLAYLIVSVFVYMFTGSSMNLTIPKLV